MDGNWSDSKGSNHGATQGWTTGKLNGALGFDGVDDKISVSNESAFDFERTQPFSIESWVKTSVGGEIFTKSDVNYKGFRLYVAPSGQIHVILANNYPSNTIFATAETNLTNNAWHHLVMAYNGSSNASGVKIYVDNVLLTSTIQYNSLSATILNNITPNVGKDTQAASYFSGMMDELRIYNVELSAGDISTLYNSGTGTEAPAVGCISAYHFNETSGTTATDYVGTNHSTLTNFNLGPTFGTAKYGTYSWNFDGVNDYVDIPDSTSWNLNSDFSREFWVKFNVLGGNTAFQMQYQDGNNENLFRITNANKLQMYSYQSGYKFLITTTNAPSFNTTDWFHIVFVRSGNTPYIYVNNISQDLTVSTAFGAAVNDLSAPLTIGGEIVNSQYLNGLLDEVAIYNTALDAATVSNHYNNN